MYSDCLWPGRPWDRSSSSGKVKNCHISISCRPALGSMQSGVQWVEERSFPGGESDRGVKLNTHHQLVPKSTKRGSVHPLPTSSLWCSTKLIKHRDGEK
jgi:hypothetical protein